MKFLLFLLLPWTACAQDFASEILHCTYKLFNEKSTATCVLVSHEGAVYIATAAHVFEKMEGKTAMLVLRTKDDEGAWVRQDWAVEVRDDEGKNLWEKDAVEDVAVLRLPKAPDGEHKTLPFSALATTADWEAARLHICSPVFVFGYPGRFESHSAGFPVARHGSLASFPFLPNAGKSQFLVDFSTFEGDSGGPVFVPHPEDAARALLIGLVIQQYRNDETVTRKFSDETIHHPLSLSGVLHTGFLRDLITKDAEERGKDL